MLHQDSNQLGSFPIEHEVENMHARVQDYLFIFIYFFFFGGGGGGYGDQSQLPHRKKSCDNALLYSHQNILQWGYLWIRHCFTIYFKYIASSSLRVNLVHVMLIWFATAQLFRRETIYP